MLWIPSAWPAAARKEETGPQNDEVVTEGFPRARLIVNRYRAVSSTGLNSPCAPRGPLLTWPSSPADDIGLAESVSQRGYRIGPVWDEYAYRQGSGSGS